MMSGARLKHRDNKGSEVVSLVVPADAGQNPVLVPDLGPITAARLEDWSRVYGIPLSTLRALRASGRGPRVFEVGRLVYCLRDDWCAWLEGLAATGGTGPLTGRTNRGTTTNPDR
jgi:hypothetical protein